MGGGMLPGMTGPFPTGASQKTIGVPLRNEGSGQGPNDGSPATWAFGFTKLANSARQFKPGSTMRIGVKPGQETWSNTAFVSAPKRMMWAPLTVDAESENCARDSPI